MADCDRSLDLLSDLRDGVLADMDASWVKAHLDGCGDCNGVFLDLEVIVVTARALASDNGLAYPDENGLWERIGIRRNIVH